MSSSATASPAIPPARPAAATAAARSGAWAAAVCYLLWGAFPLYWKQLAAVNPVELIAHRYVWTCVIVVILLVAQRRFGEVRAALGTARG